MIRSDILQVGGLLVSNIWVYGDVMDLEITKQETGVGSQESMRALVTVFCRPLKTYRLLASTNFLDWIPVATNTPAGSRFDYLDTFGSADGPPALVGDWPGDLFGIPFGGAANGAGEPPAPPQRFFRAVMLEHLYDSIGLSLQGVGPGGTRPCQARLTLSNAQPAHTLILQASEDFGHWTSLSTNTPAAVTNWLFLDTNAPAFNQRFYRAIGQGKVIVEVESCASHPTCDRSLPLVQAPRVVRFDLRAGKLIEAAGRRADPPARSSQFVVRRATECLAGNSWF